MSLLNIMGKNFSHCTGNFFVIYNPEYLLMAGGIFISFKNLRISGDGEVISYT